MNRKDLSLCMQYINMNKAFAFVAITILLLTSFIPVAENVSAKEAKEIKTIEVPVKIYTLQGIREIRKELPVNEARKLMHMANETKDAIAALLSKNAPFMEKVKANAIIDSFLYELKKNGLLGDISIKEVKELVTGKYSIKSQKMMLMIKSLKNSGWEVNTICLYQTGGYTYNFHPWNFMAMVLLYWAINQGPLPRWLIPLAIFILFCIVGDYIPHPTTMGFWIIEPGGFYEKEAYLATFGLFGEKTLTTKDRIIAFTFGFTGIVFTLPALRSAIGFSSFVAFKKWQ